MVLNRGAASGSSASTRQPIRYHVFLSFRGPDSRRTFTDHLYAALLRKGIVTFRDDLEIEKGKAVEEQLRKAIQQSRYFIIVLSEQFASSRWCLNELLEIMKTKQKDSVFPVFYDVQPGEIGQALAKLNGRYSGEKIRQWSQVLSEVAKFSGWPTENKHEAKLVEEIATNIWNKLCNQLRSNFEYLVGDMQSRAERIISLLGIGLDHKCFLGIWGMGGAGKTTLGRVVYDTANERGNFDASCFLTDIREDSKKFGLIHLQKKLLSDLQLGEPNNIKDSFHGAQIIKKFLCDKKVLIVLDDVGHRSQLDNLARNEEWFGAGSKIIITTRDKHLLTQYKDFHEYKVDMLCEDESLKLLRQKAFKKDHPGEDFTNLSKEVVKYSGGLPMALEVLGSFLCTREQYEWRRTIDTLRQDLNKEILSQLRISYDELEEKYKKIFLDIACFFNKEAKFKVANMLKMCGLDEIVGIKVLTEKSLLSSSQSRQNAKEGQNMHDRLQKMRVNTEIESCLYKALEKEASKEYLYMHDLLQEMGRNIVFQESPINAGERSRLWSLEDIDLVLKENKGTEHVQSIVLETQEDFKAEWDPNCLSKMINLRLLDLSKVSIKLESLPTALKFLRWDDYAGDRQPSIEKLCNLESLQLCNSKIRKLWERDPVLNKLRIIDMSGSESLSETPDFSGTPNLEEMSLNGCRKLTQVHESVGQLKKLVKLSLEECVELVTLPTPLETNNLQEFILMGCRKLKKLPDFGKDMRSLYFLNVRNTRIAQIPSTIRYLVNLKILDLRDCHQLKSLPAALSDLALIACPSNSLNLRNAIAQLNLGAPRVPERPGALQGPIHIFPEFRAGEKILKWFDRLEYWWGKDSSGEFVTITADIQSVADYDERQCWGIAVCLFLRPLSQAQRSYMVWRFQDKSDAHKSEMHGILCPDDDEWGVYIGFYPFDKEQCRPHPGDESRATRLDLTLSFLTTKTVRDVRDLAIMGCQWRLASKLDFDCWEERALSPSSGHGSPGSSSNNRSTDMETNPSVEQPQSSLFTGKNNAPTPIKPSSTPGPGASCQPSTAIECPPPSNATGNDVDCGRKRKRPERKPAQVWNHFTKLPLDKTNGEIRATCKYCNADYAWDLGKYGTTSLKRHLSKCTKNPHKAIQISKQPILNYVSSSGQGISLMPHAFNQKRCRRALAEFIICDEMPFRIVENQGFKMFVKELEPRFQIPSRTTIARDCWQLYLGEVKILKNVLKKSSDRVCLTVDCWTSVQNFNYLCLTAHFVDNDWNLQKRILNFYMIEDYRGDTIGKTIEGCLLEWGIQNVFTITMDNATSNDSVFLYLKKRLKNWKGIVCGGDYLQLQCSTHILNLVVNDGLKELEDSFESIRLAVRYVRSSPSRLEKFKQLCELEMLDTKKMHCLDVTTGWSSTYLMLDVAVKFQKVFERLEDENEDYIGFFNKCLKHDSTNVPPKRNGPPNRQTWNKARFFLKFLKVFFDVALLFSKSLLVTANTCFHQIAMIQELLDENIESDDPLLKEMCLSMRSKYDKYWGAADNLNPLLIIAVILDPRYKFAYINHMFEQLYPQSKLCMPMKNKAKNTLYRLFEEYSTTIGSKPNRSGSCITSISSSSSNTSNANEGKQDPSRRWLAFQKEKHASVDTQSELDRYLSDNSCEDIPIDDEKFDILAWWKINSSKYRVLSMIARDVMAIPVSTVASESTFRTRRRILDDFRNSLSPKMTEALICTQNWLLSGQSLTELISKLNEFDNFQEIDNVVSDGANIIDGGGDQGMEID